MALTRITRGVIKPNENYDTHNIVSTGIVTSVGLDVNGNADVSGSLSVGGVLTYEDVTSIDSIGIITARSGIDADDFISVGNNIHLGNAGVITATSFVGSGAALTGIDATAIKDSGGNVKIQAQASGAIHSGVSTFQDIDVDGHTNLDNVSVAGVSTFASDVAIGRSMYHVNDIDTSIGFPVNGTVRISGDNERVADFTGNYGGGGQVTFYKQVFVTGGTVNIAPTIASSTSPVITIRNASSHHTVANFQNTNNASSIIQWNNYNNSSTAGNLIFRSLNSPNT